MRLEINETINVSSWRNGSQNAITGAGYGIRISIHDIVSLQHWHSIEIDKSYNILNRENHVFNINCPEIRSSFIGLFLIENNLEEWSQGKPHKLRLTHLGQNNFKLHL